MNSINYKKNVLSLVNDLSVVTPSVIFKKENNQIVVRRANMAESIAYELKTKKEIFDFLGDELAFYNFPEFYQILSSFTEPNIKQKIDNQNEDDEITTFLISKDKSRIIYKISDISSLRPNPSEFPSMDDNDLNFIINGDDLKELQKMKGLINASNLKINMSDGILKLELFSNSYDNSFDKEYIISNSKVEKINMVISTEILSVLPKGDYNVKINTEGIITFTLKNDDIELVIITAELEEE